MEIKEESRLMTEYFDSEYGRYLQGAMVFLQMSEIIELFSTVPAARILDNHNRCVL